ncbi:MAG: hypothetical protein WC656_06690 [Sulfurimonas sp.]
MNIDGKVLFFNQNDGKGTIITSQREKIGFSVDEWNDFDVMPCTGLVVNFDLKNGVALNIIAELSKPKVSIGSDVVNEYEPEKFSEVEENIDFTHLEKNSKNAIVSDNKFQSEDEEKFIIVEELANVSGEILIQSKEEKLPDDVVVFPDDEPTEEHFEDRDDIDILKDDEIEIPARENSITVTLNLPLAVANYFKVIQEHVAHRSNYKKVAGRLDYLVIRRFIWTTYNNLSEIDLHIITPKVKALADDLKIMGKVYEDFSIKVKHPRLAFEEVFLSCQAEYNKIREGAEKVVQKLTTLRANEKIIGGTLRVKKEELEKNIKSQEFDVMKQELKSLNGSYVDVVHMMAELNERYKHDLKLLHEFEREYRDDFYTIFATESKKYYKSIVDILDAQAYIVDAQLWQQAKVSKSVKAHFKKSAIEGELNTKTYLKYYLDTLDSKKASDDTKKLFELYDYLVSIQKDYILVVVSSPQEAMEYESCIKNSDKSYEVKSFIDEKTAIKWAMKNSVKILVLEDSLQKTNAETFLNVYHNNVLVKPKIILIGNKPKSNSSAYTITKLLLRNAPSKVVAESVKAILNPPKS